MSLRDEARKAKEGEYVGAARDLMLSVLGDPAGEVSALTVEHLAVGPTFTLTVFTDGDLRLGSQIYADGRDPWFGLVSLGADGKWTRVSPVTSLVDLHDKLATYDPGVVA